MIGDSASLLTRWREGDLLAGQTLFNEHYSAIATFFRNKIGADALDLVQETFAACVESRDRIKGTFRAYLFGVAHNVLKKHIKSKYRPPEPVDFDSVAIHDLTPSPSELVVQKAEQRLLLEGLRHISINDQILLELRYWESMTTAEIATVLDCPHATIRSRLRRAREKLEYQIARLEAGPLLHSTLTRLEHWAERCRVAART